jgi:glycyl-tRNA synthetase alpha chain
MKPSPENIVDLYLESLRALGIVLEDHDVRFVEDDWESAALGASGVGWEVWLDGTEITQFTFFQQMGGIACESVAAEITYGTERLATLLQGVASFWDLEYAHGLTYAETERQAELEHCIYNFEEADTDMLFMLFDTYEAESKRILDGRQLVAPAFDFALRCSHTFNLLDARGVIGVTERAMYINRIRARSRACCVAFLHQRKELGFPLLKSSAKDAQNV